MAASATFALKAGVWFRRGRLLIVSPDSLGTACPLSGRNSTYRPVQIREAGSGALIASRRRFSVVCRWWWVPYVLDGPFDLIEHNSEDKGSHDRSQRDTGGSNLFACDLKHRIRAIFLLERRPIRFPVDVLVGHGFLRGLIVGRN
jgi:hypothetical protein